MSKIKGLIKKAFTPLTIMLVPHSNRSPLNIKLPAIGIVLSLIFWIVGTVYVFSVAVNAFEYKSMKEKLGYYSSQFVEMKSTIAALKTAEVEFKRIFSFKSKTKVLENLDISDTGSIDIEALKQQVTKTIETVSDIKDYLRQQRDILMATPRGWPLTSGHITSLFGKREHPIFKEGAFHTGVDVATNSGNPILATADGIVSFSGWSGGNGNMVVIEHGFGFSTCYAHNRMNNVKVGDKVKRGDIIGYIGSTGNTTGPHVHYEVWKNGNAIDPKPYMEGKG